MRYDTGLGLGRLSMCDLLPGVDGSGCGRGICFASKNAGTVLGPLRMCVEDYCCTCCPCDLPRTQPVRGRLLVRHQTLC